MSNPKTEIRNSQPQTCAAKPVKRRRASRCRGLSILELMLALTISAMVLTATMAAIDASFKAYADAAEQASSQAATRMITHRLIAMIRTSNAHGPLLADNDADFPVTVSSDNIVSSRHIELLDANGDIIHREARG